MTRDCGHSTGDDQRLQTFGEGGRYLNLTGTHSHFRRVVPPPPPCSLVGHVTDPTRLQGHSQSTALLANVQWAPGCETTSCHSRVPTLKMLVPGEKTADGSRTPLDQGTGRTEERVLLHSRAERPARYSNTGIPGRPLHIRSIRRTDIFPHFLGGKK
ncbi:unnamed protein product, partial [Staurois parvus]